MFIAIGNYIGGNKPVDFVPDADTVSFINAVTADGGQVGDIKFLNGLIVLLKEVNWYDKLRVAISPLFAYKQNGGFVSKLYNIHLPSTNSLEQLEGSAQPELGSGELGSLKWVELDGIDDNLTVTASIKEATVQTPTHILLANLRDLSGGGTSCYIVGSGTSFGIRTNKTSGFGEFREQTLTVNGSAGSLGFLPANGNINSVQLNQWYLAAWAGGYLRLNNLIYQHALTATLGALSSWSVGRGNSTQFSTSAMAINLLFVDSEPMPTHILNRIYNYIYNYTGLAEQLNYDSDIFTEIPNSDIDGVFSLYRLLPEYTGSCIKLRRDSDNQEMDFGFANSDLYSQVDVSAIDSWRGGSNVYLVTWYDQSQNSNYITAGNSVQPQFLTTGGGKATNLPYILPSASEMTRATTIDATTNFRVFAGYKGSTAGTLFRSGSTTNAFSHRIVSSNYYFNKRIATTTYGKFGAPTSSRQSSINSLIRVMMFGNTANTPASSDTVFSHNGELMLSSSASNLEFSSSGNITLFKGSTADWANETHFIISLKNVSDAVSDIINHKLTVFYQIDK